METLAVLYRSFWLFKTVRHKLTLLSSFLSQLGFKVAMGHDNQRPMLQYQPEVWRKDDNFLSPEQALINRRHRSDPDVRDQTLILEMLGRVNYKIIKGQPVYVEAEGVVYKTLYGGYWRSVFTGIEHYLLKCEKVSGSIWTEGSAAADVVDLPIAFSNDGWTASGYAISFMLSRE